MTTAEATSNRYSSKTTRRRRYRSHRPLLAQKFSVASKALSSLRNDTETRSLNTIDFYSDGASSDRRMVGPISQEEPEGRLFSKAGDPVILAPGEQHRYLVERRQKDHKPDGKFEFLESIEEQHGGPLRFESWYIDVFWEDRRRDDQLSGFIGINEQLRRVYNNREMRKTSK